MSATTEPAALYPAIAKAAALLEVPCSRDEVGPVLAAFEDVLPQAVIALRVTTGRDAGDLDCRFTVPNDVDPYARARSNGLTPDTDHPVGRLLSDLERRFPIASYAVDFGVVRGFKKAWAFFPPDDQQELTRLAGVPSMPRSLAGNIELFARYGLDGKASVIGIDYPHRTLNVYFGDPPAECFEPENILSLLRDIGLPDPSEQMLKLSQDAFGIYATLNWDSAKVERICFSVTALSPASIPVHLDPKIERFVKDAAVDDRFAYGIALTADGEYLKFQSYQQWQPRILRLMGLNSSEGPG